MSDPDLTKLRALVAECRKTLETEVCELTEELGPALIGEARALVSTSPDQAKRKDALLLHEELQGKWAKVTPMFRDALARRAGSAKSTDRPRPDDQNLAGLQILGDDELAAQIAMRAVVERVSSACNEETSALDRRITYLVLRTVLTQGDTTFRVASVCACLETACAAIFPEAKQRALLLQLIGGHLAAELPQLYRAINETLIDADILPRLKRSYRNQTPPSTGVAAAESAHMISTLERLAKARTPVGGMGAAPVDAAAGRNFLTSLQTLEKAPAAVAAGALTNVVRLARDSEEARHVQPVEAVALDIVSALFDLIFGDAEISDGIKLLVSRLQMPVLKVAMINQQFFADRSHPARRFLDSISGIAIRWGKFVNASDPFYLSAPGRAALDNLPNLRPPGPGLTAHNGDDDVS